MHVIIDCRFAFCSGIGRYIREVVPRILRFEGHSFTVILRREDEDTSFGRACVGAHVRRMFSTAAMYSLQEQVELPWRTPPGDVFWAMHYDAPCFPLRTHYRIVTIHDMCHLAFQQDMPWFKKCYAQWFMYAASHFYDKILTVSHFSKQEILKYEGVAEDKVVVTGCAVERMRYHPHRDLSQEQKVRERYGLPKEFFLFVGNGKPHKNLEALLQAYARFHGACATVPALVIVGGFQPLEGNAVRQRLSENQGLSMVHFVGAVEELELPSGGCCGSPGLDGPQRHHPHCRRGLGRGALRNGEPRLPRRDHARRGLDRPGDRPHRDCGPRFGLRGETLRCSMVR